MAHYTMVKTTTFNGVHHPDIAIYDPAQKEYRVVRRFGARNIAGGMAHRGLDTQRDQPLQSCAVAEVRTRDGVAHVQQHLGDAGHARAADTDEVDMGNGVLHAASSSHA